jgi:hypothetical protein
MVKAFLFVCLPPVDIIARKNICIENDINFFSNDCLVTAAKGPTIQLQQF